MVNRYQPHVIVLPEDDANRQLANGFVLALDEPAMRKIQILNEAGGWIKALNSFESDHVNYMDKFKDRHIVLLIDFDDDPQRFNEATRKIPRRLRNRTFVLGSRSDPESLQRAGMGTLEEIGGAIANDCRERKRSIWKHDLLRHNEAEIERMSQSVRAILFE